MPKALSSAQPDLFHGTSKLHPHEASLLESQIVVHFKEKGAVYQSHDM